MRWIGSISGPMEISVLQAVLKSISRFFLLSISTTAAVKCELVQKYYLEIDEALKLLRPVLDSVVDSEVAADEQLVKALGDLDASICAAQELIANWHQLKSKLYLVLQIEPLIMKIQSCSIEICNLVEFILVSLPNVSNLHCIQKLQQIGLERISNVIKEAIRDKVENDIYNTESLTIISESLSLNSNQELLLEAVVLEGIKTKADHDDNNEDSDYIDHMIGLVSLLHECLVKEKQSQTVNGVQIPDDFCCPLSLELMSDPVILASGQTYDRVFIRKWLDQGLTVCPKSHQTLTHTNLIPNFTVKGLIASWCEMNGIEIPDPVKTVALTKQSTLLDSDFSLVNSHIFSHTSSTQCFRSPERKSSLGLNKSYSSSSGIHVNGMNSSLLHVASSNGVDGVEIDITGMTIESSTDMEVSSEAQNSCFGGETSNLSCTDSSRGCLIDKQSAGHTRNESVSTVDADEPLNLSGELTPNSSDMSGELTSETPFSSAPPREVDCLSCPAKTTRSKSQTIWHRPSERLITRIFSAPPLDSRPDLSGIETQVIKLVEDLQSSSPDVQREAAAEIRLLAKHSMDNRSVITNQGAIGHLVTLLCSPDLKTQENAVTALLNLSINDNNKALIANMGAIDPLIHVLETGSQEAKENSAATLFSLSVVEENKVKIGRSGAIRPLVDLLGSGTPRGKKDAVTALFNLSIYHENKARIVHAGTVRHLVELLDPAAGMVDKAVAVLSNLANIPEGRSAIGQEGGIPGLVEVVELGSSRGKENAAAALLQLCRNSNRFCNMVLQEGAVPPLVALSQMGTPRAKEKAQTLLNYFRNQRRGNAARG
ncbi:U-box domain-containing protein 4-like isoform X2 [Aristolochia californica]|uniref:U-box domain-containing protein 4-like isoform X2 n=1 Tax=Aristolochia californica TaxID=171875 RepID=UPI0035DC0C4E